MSKDMTEKKDKVTEGLRKDAERQQVDTQLGYETSSTPTQRVGTEHLDAEQVLKNAGYRAAKNPKRRVINLDGKKRLSVQHGSSQHEMLLQAGYHMTREEAEQIIKEREKKPELWPFEMAQKAKAFLKALNAKPEPVSKTPHWRRRRRYLSH